MQKLIVYLLFATLLRFTEMFKFALICYSLSLVMINHVALAHSEHDKVRFVAVQGQDIGKCDNVLRPCKSIAYAVSQANKGDKVLVSAGKYAVTTSEELFFFKSELVPVMGGYNRYDHFQSQSPKSNLTVLTGVPVELAQDLRDSGFTVVADGKSLALDKALQEKFSDYNQLSQKQAELNCVNNKAGSFDCNNIDLLAHMPLGDFSSKPSAANDIWGHVDLNTGDEYAILGIKNGVAVVNVSDPISPVEVGTINGISSGWRDVKVYQHFDESLNLWRAYAYSSMDVEGIEYITIIDLNHLPHSVNLVERNRAVAMAHNIYITNVDHTLNIALPGLTPSLQIVGSDEFSGAFNSYSLTNPATLTPLSNVTSRGNGYTHDGASLNITDNRKNTDCQTSDANCTVFIDFNEKEMKLWNISDADNVKALGIAEYNDVNKENQYVHSGWGSEDKQFIFLHDEFDEYKGGLNSTVRIFSIADLNNPQQVGQWTGTTKAIDHNGFVRGNRYYMSNYQRGLTVLDITNPATPVEVGNFDTYTPSNNASFAGAWGAYPFLPSGNILISDINSGLYILKDNTLSSTQGTISFKNKNITAIQGQSLQIPVQRFNVNDAATTSTVAYELLSGSAKENDDYTAVSGILTWQGNDSSDKTIAIDVTSDTSGEEFQEDFYVRLYDPQNGVTLSPPSYLTVNVDGLVDRGAISFIQSELTIAENQNTITIEVSRDGSSNGEVAINYHLQSIDAELGADIEESSGTLIWFDGESENQTIILNVINDDVQEDDESFILLLETVDDSRLGANKQITITISDDDSNTAPLLSLGENIQVNAGQTVNLVATATDNENDLLTYLWEQTSGTDVSLASTIQANTSFVAPATAGTLIFTATVTDNKGAITTASLTITVIAEVITITPQSSGGSGSGGMINFYLLLILLLLFLRAPYNSDKTK